MELNIKKCLKCGAYNYEISPCNCEGCGIKCCNENMVNLTPNSEDAAVEKHVPTYEILNGKIEVNVNHVMEDEHYIEWVCLFNETDANFHFFKPGDEAKVIFDYKENSILYAYCNKHGLWKAEVK